MAAPKKRKLTTREPKRILKRKPESKKTSAKRNTSKRTAAKKTTGRKPASAKTTTRSSAVDRKAEDLKLTEKLKSYQDKGLSLKDASEKLGIRPAKARRLLQTSSVRPKDKIVGTDKDVASKIKKARDDEGVSWGVLRARTGLTTRKIKAMYASAGGKGTSTTKKTAAKKPTTRKAKTNTRTTAKRSAKSTTKAAAKTKATARAPRTRKTKAAKTEATDNGSSGLTSRQRRRAQKSAESKKRLDTLWDLDSTDKQVKDAIEGRTLVVTREMNGHKITPTEHSVGTVKQIGISNREGRVIHFVDENQQNRVITAREVTDLK
jgi:hypothetical protein